MILALTMLGIAAARDLWFMLMCAGFMGVSLPLLTIGYLTLIQKRTPQALMGRVSTAAEVVMSVPGAVSLAVGAALVSVLDYRVIFVIVGVVTLAGAAHIGFWLREQIRTDWQAGRGGSVDEGLRGVGVASSTKAAAPAIRTPGDHVVGGDATSLGALGADGQRPSARTASLRCASGAEVELERLGPPRDSRTTTPRRSATGRLGTPATAVAATVNAWVHRSASSVADGHFHDEPFAHAPTLE